MANAISFPNLNLSNSTEKRKLEEAAGNTLQIEGTGLRFFRVIARRIRQIN